MDEDIAKQVLDNIYDTRFSKYYWTIQPGRAGTLHYNSGNLESEYINIIHPTDVSSLGFAIREKILKTFLVGNKYSKPDIKETLRKIYEDCGYNKTPKASDLNIYFEIKLCKVIGSSDKQDNGFKIIKIKD